VPQMREQEGVFCPWQCLRGDLQEELTTPKRGKPKVKQGRLSLHLALQSASKLGRRTAFKPVTTVEYMQRRITPTLIRAAKWSAT
jgi:hypothetical protein